MPNLKDTSINSFHGHYLYDQILASDHLFVKLVGAVDWSVFTRKLMKLYKGGGEYGPPPYDPALILRMLLVSYLYNISERATEEFVRYFIPAKYFVGLGVDELPPDHSTLTVFKERLLKHSGQKAVEAIFNEIIRQAKSKGVQFGDIQAIDSTHSWADVNPDKDRQRKNKQNKPPRDPDASWGTKRVKKVKDSKGKTQLIPERFHGYKIHASMNHQADLITSLVVTTGAVHDGHYLKPLINKDLKKKIPLSKVTADKGYDDGDLVCFLEERNILPAIALRKTRTAKKWQELKEDLDYQQALKKRPQIERLFGEAKKHHGLASCRYLGKQKLAIQAYFTFMAMNLKRMVKHHSTNQPFPSTLPPRYQLALSALPRPPS